MSLDDLITLLLVILFVGAPLLRRILGRRGGQPGEERRAEGEGEPGPGRAPMEGRGQTAAERAETARADRGATASTREVERPESEFERKLSEARRRVQEAREQRDRTTREAGRRDLKPPEAPDRRVWEEPPAPLVRTRTDAEKAAGLLGREGSRQPRPKTAPLKVERRRRKRRGSTLSSARDVVSTERQDILRGIVWHQILSEPVSKRPPRRKPLRVR